MGGLGIALIGVGVMAPNVYAGLSEFIGSLMLFFGLAYYAKAKGRSPALCLWGLPQSSDGSFWRAIRRGRISRVHIVVVC